MSFVYLNFSFLGGTIFIFNGKCRMVLLSFCGCFLASFCNVVCEVMMVESWWQLKWVAMRREGL